MFCNGIPYNPDFPVCMEIIAINLLSKDETNRVTN